MAVSATVGCLLARHMVGLLAVAAIWAFVYGMLGVVSSPAQWVGQQCCTFLVVSSAFPSTDSASHASWSRRLGGGVLQLLFIKLLWHFVPPAGSAVCNQATHPDGWQFRTIGENLTFESPTFGYALRLVFIAVTAILTYRFLNFANARLLDSHEGVDSAEAGF